MTDLLEYEIDFSTCNYLIDMFSIMVYEIENTITNIFLTQEELDDCIREGLKE